MKLRVFLLIILSSWQVFAQKQKANNQTTFYLDSLNNENKSINILKWKFQSGDNNAWASKEFDDSKWGIIMPSDDFVNLPEFDKQPIGWLRLKIIKPKGEKTVIFQIVQVAASEIYLNGQKVASFGHIDKDPEKTVGYNPLRKPVIINFTADTLQTVAIRIAKPAAAVGYGNPTFPKSLLNFTITEQEEALGAFERNFNKRILGTVIKWSIFLILFILHFSYFRSQKSNLGNLFFAFFTLAGFINETLYLLIVQYIHNVSWYPYLVILALISNTAYSLFLLLAVYTLFELKKNWMFWAVFSGFALTSLVNIFNSDIGLVSYFCLLSVLYIQLTVVLFKALEKGKRGSKIMLFGIFSIIIISSIALITNIYFSISIDRKIVQTVSNYYGIYLLHIKDIVLSICLSIYLALEFSYLNKELTAKLLEIEHISNEKEQILKSQNETLEKQVAERTSALNQSLMELKNTQNQLVQQEKLASLGELTAGIAHEIQNPLNFVNNFSEVSTELIDELREEREKPHDERDIELEEELLGDVFQNLKKINHHGKRASGIVKGMLEHSRASTGEKQLTDINALADEYLRLSYHGLRAKDKAFNSDFKMNFEENLPKTSVIPQDVGRVLLNLFNNAFYAVYKKAQSGKATEGYKPLVVVSTHQLDNEIIIKVKDNGLGISQEHISKIFQPFFTTKPTGEGTGLGLSISYDIITKGHGGTMKVESTEGEGTVFTISLPIS